jgi:hypothetical protein
MSGDQFGIDIYYTSLDVKTKTETLVYDFGNMMAAAGPDVIKYSYKKK